MACLLLISFYFLSRQAAQVSAELGKQKNTETIMVDPGHGGKDPGMVGVGGLEEKGINLEISLILRDVLEERGWNVLLTRESDKGLYDETADNKKAQDLQRRIALIDEKKPVLTVSIHQNSYEDQTVKGPQVFYYESSSEGKKLAECIQETMNKELGIEKVRKAKGNTSYYLLKRSSSVLVIAECGFMTNPEEAELLQTAEYQKRIAEALADGIEKYLSDL
ncbi:MAG TPA: N-acetylmuramoyl-L-alanine amidase [Candidatus Blautia intestinipullorum]|nr:N-acetylmuramoyl-L-alanine amidase [Candidatus Blautia intestinipullorum]